MPNPLRNLPSVSQLLESPPLKKMVDTVSHNTVVGGVRTVLGSLRDRVSSATEDINIPSANELAETIASWIKKNQQPVLVPVINATGVILHTGLGRSPLAKEAVDAINEVAMGYCSLEFDLESGQRGQRVHCVQQLLCELTGAEAATVVNNNAAATMLTLGALGGGGEVIVSRGQLIEIGGSYRLPEVMETSGAKLREVGATNKTHLRDYEDAIGEETRALMRVHPSNFKIVGFTKEVSLEDLVKLGRKHGLPVIDDIGSGALIDFARYGVSEEPISSASIDAGADVVLFSGDKLVGGPQCGIIIGKKKYIARIMKHPMMRAMRVGKLTLSALWATLRLYQDLDKAELSVPILQMLSTPLENLHLRSDKIAKQIELLPFVESAEPVQDHAMLGGGSLPTEKIDTWCVAITPQEKTIEQITTALRTSSPAVVARVQKEKILLDMRTVQPSEDLKLVDVFSNLFES